MICLVGESGAGKSSVEKILCERYGYKKIVSYTTRSPREGEFEGSDYHFVRERRFEEMKSSNQFAEFAIYNGWQYGIGIEDCTEDKVVVVTPHGMRMIKKLLGEKVFAVYIDVPRRDRLIKILQRGDNIEEAYRRSLSDVGMFDGIKDEANCLIQNPDYMLSLDNIAEQVHARYMEYINA